MTDDRDDTAATPTLTVEQAYEAAYRFVAQYYARERIVPFMLMLHSMGWEEYHDHHITNDPASWPEWQECVEKTVDRVPLPDIPNPDRPRESSSRARSPEPVRFGHLLWHKIALGIIGLLVLFVVLVIAFRPQ